MSPKTRMAAFQGMLVLPAKHSDVWLPRKCDYWHTDRQTVHKAKLCRRHQICWMPDIWPWCFNLKSFIIKPYTCSIFPISRQRPLSKTMIWKWFQKQETHNTYVWPHPSLSCWPCAREDLSLFWQGWQRTVNYWPCATCGKKDCV